MKSRALPLWLAVTAALLAAVFWLRQPHPEPPGKPVEAPVVKKGPSLSDLAPIPDWNELNAYQSTITRAEFLREMDAVFTVSPAWREWFEVGTDEVKIRTSPDPVDVFRLRFAPEGLEGKPSRYWRDAGELGPAPAERPLDGVKIAIDPGHIGGFWGKIEERWFQIPGGQPVLEGDMTLRVAGLLKPKLEALGATVTLVRDRTEPVTELRPENLREEAGRSAAGGDIAKLAERLFYRTAEIRARARKVNESIRPDLVLCLHFNADAWGNPNSPTLVPANHFHMILNGAYTDDEVALADQRHEMMLKLLQRIHREETAVSTSAATAFVERTGMRPYLYLTTTNVRNVDGNPYLWARNLLANRTYHCPVIYYEPYVMNSVEDHERMQAGDYEGERMVAGKMRPSIFREYADCVALGLERHYRARRAGESGK
jgi:N-acetylmuramoyl-L-alanine amidase